VSDYRRSTTRLMGLVVMATLSAASGPGNSPASKPGANRPRELGNIDWVRGFDAAVKKAEAENKPVLVLFQEVPGCHTCVDYGERVLSHPLIVDAAATLFVPVAIYNNVKGDDERILKSFKEPAWNNPVVRIVAADRRPLAQRVAEDYTVGGLASAMVEALEKDHRKVPSHLRLLAEESAARKRGLGRATFAMHCFWEGEGTLGTVPGIVSTTPGFLRKEEVVEVEFDPGAIEYAALVRKAKALSCADRVYARNDDQASTAHRIVGSSVVRTDEAIRPDKSPKYYLAQTVYRHVPMTGLQASRVNAAIGRKQNPDECLSPGQLALLEIVQQHAGAAWPNAIGAEDLPKAWHAAQAVAQSLRK